MPGEEEEKKQKNPEKKAKVPSKSGKTGRKERTPSKSRKRSPKSKGSEKEAKGSSKSDKESKLKGAVKEYKESSKSEEGAEPKETEGKSQEASKSEEKEIPSKRLQKQDQESAKSEEEGTVSEETLKTYITAYIDSYMNYVEEQNIKEGDFPLLYAYYPLDVTGYILQDDSTCILFKGLAAATNITVEKADYNAIDSEITDKRYDYISCYPPSFTYTKEEAEKQAKRDVDGDIEHSKVLGTVKADRAAKDETLKSIRLLFVAMPWVAQRKIGEGSLKFPESVEGQQFTSEGLSMKEEEYFSGFSDRIHTLENAFLHGAKIPSEPSEEDEKDIEESKPAEPVAAESAVPVAAAAAAPGTHVTVEIKQPETPGKGEMYKDRDEDILRLKKTLYIQSRDIEELRRQNDELGGKLGNLEQMRQTVFRVNRKVFDSDAKMAKLERSNMETLRKFAELRIEQAEQNKKMRRFIAERAKKARNQAMALAGIALALGMTALILLILEIDIKTLLGL